MGYSTSPDTVRKWMPYLEPLRDGAEVRWRAPRQARWLAYKIRECLSVAKRFPEEFPELAVAARAFRIEQHGDDEVQARRRAISPPLDVSELAPAAQPQRHTDAHVDRIAAPELIVQEWARVGRTSGKLYFPNADIGIEGLEVLLAWAEDSGVLLFENAGAITLLDRENNLDAAPFALTKEDLDEMGREATDAG